jgi:hypothetical protein
MEQIAQAPIIKSQNAVLARSKPDRSRRHGRIEHSDAASHKKSTSALHQVAYIEGSRIRENSVTLSVGDRILTNPATERQLATARATDKGSQAPSIRHVCRQGEFADCLQEH